MPSQQTQQRVEQEYFEWLISQIFVASRSRTYYGLFQRMHETEFVWFIDGDDNRVEDGRELRREFLDGARYQFQFGVSVLEVLIALSRRIEFIAEGDASRWAWKLLKNLRLHRISDPITDQKLERIDEILHTLIWRTYQRDGRGGFFPLRNTIEDQIAVEIWYQMQVYISEMLES